MYKFALIVFLSIFTFPLTYATANSDRIVALPKCLLANVHIEHKLIAENNRFVLITMQQKDVSKLVEAKHVKQKTACGGFIDVTVDWQNKPKNQRPKQFLLRTISETPLNVTSSATQYEIRYENKVLALLGKINPDNLWQNLTTFSSFHDRYANSDNGVKAAEWLQNEVSTLTKANHRNDVSISTIKTGNSYKQPSVVIKIGDSSESGIVVSAHMDTTSGVFAAKPGADDDGSGSMTLLELARVLLTSDEHFKKPIYLIWYAAEEEGLVGSGYVVSHFKQSNIPIDAVLHFDMTGFAYKNDPTIWLMKDYVNKDLTNFLEKLIVTYLKQPVAYTACGYACSDHATWTRNGFAASIAAEAKFENTNPAMHSSADTIEKLSLKHMTDYVKLAVAFATELAEPI